MHRAAAIADWELAEVFAFAELPDPEGERPPHDATSKARPTMVRVRDAIRNAGRRLAPA